MWNRRNSASEIQGASQSTCRIKHKTAVAIQTARETRKFLPAIVWKMLTIWSDRLLLKSPHWACWATADTLHHRTDKRIFCKRSWAFLTVLLEQPENPFIILGQPIETTSTLCKMNWIFFRWWPCLLQIHSLQVFYWLFSYERQRTVRQLNSVLASERT